ncbi:tetratricopeptide repeat protein [Paenibacillus mucilaginosus]|uniref:TPR repeat-containing protein n=2 Tax=Paenibacillus mucilaginosus TaxID=61624 RepID=H6NH52_9BACL|nr:tetratricopeptide repeat protein [Paenibacillus mucilaginosus]AEI40078.1 TPR repeat-containing protein [Paenibacillus mucilaginosus KNP414]AFC28730.1 TPR repeat-containing protein [Paenibacillus mucilaginosus 3016]MCG7215684.1 tetratricopeptide repeat protein [Paenibacillus mucilaginosus]WDM29316.1 tetratricopeptide repeat protein [Paenibacillus mucilaginosus]WFA17503.1 tetratricopeptide repeat protein [Paenibacillus mucilaginosus]
MSKFLLFGLLFWLTGNPFVAILVLLVIFYVLDRRFVGITPSIFKPIQRMRRLSRLKEELRMNPHHTSTKLDIARIYMEQRKYADAKELLGQVLAVMEDSADVLSELGICELKLGRPEEGERLILEAVERNPRVKYGEPYLRLGEAFAERDKEKAVGYLQRFREVNSSSCEAYYRLGQLYRQLGRDEEARGAFREAVELYRGLPKYKRRHERRWALLARFRS